MCATVLPGRMPVLEWSDPFPAPTHLKAVLGIRMVSRQIHQTVLTIGRISARSMLRQHVIS